MPWQPGQSGNPNGRPKKGQSLTEALEGALTQAKRRKLARKVVELALEGNLQAIAFVFDRIDGKVPQRVDVTARLRRIAEEAGLDPEEAILVAERIVKEAQAT